MPLVQAVVLLVVGCLDASPSRTPADWNVLLITLDTVRADALGPYGQTRPTTPVLDRIAREGVVFLDVTSAAPHTVASHASIMTGLYPFAHGARANHGFPLALEHTTLAEILANAGHRTRAEIAAPVLHASTRIAQGFEPEERATSPDGDSASPLAKTPGGGLRRSSENVTQRALETIEAWRDVPFFLWLHYFDAHLPYVDRPADLAVFPDAPYLAQIHALDRSLGRIFEALDENGLRDHTLVVVTSDHGEGLGEHAEPTHSYFVYDSTMRVPLLLWGPPTLPPGRRVAGPVRTVDILPTVLDLMEREVPTGLHGRSLAPVLSGDAEPAEAPVYGESLDLHRIFGTTPVRLLREGRWKYIHSASPELYDLATDPAELDDRVERRPEIAARLAARLRALLETSEGTRREGPGDLAVEDRERLEALGYVVPRAGPRLEDEIALLDPRGPEPGNLARVAETLSRAKGAIAGRRYARAIEWLQPIASAHPESATVLAMLGEAFAGAGQDAEALSLFDRALAVEKDPCSETRLDRARAFERFGRPQDRIDELEAALEHCSDSATYLNELAWALATTPETQGGDGERAVMLARRLVGLGSGEPDPNQLDTLAAAFFAAGSPEQAVATQERALSILIRSGAGPKLRAGYAKSLDRYRRAANAAKKEVDAVAP